MHAVNDVALWSTPAPSAPGVPVGTAGIFDYTGAFQASGIVRVPENLAGAGAVVATATAYDPDQVGELEDGRGESAARNEPLLPSPAQVNVVGRQPSWGVKVYSLDPVGDYALFNISNATGAITPAAPLVWNDQPTYALTVRCSDASTTGPSLSATMAFSIALIQVNTVSVTGFGLPNGTPATSGFAVAGSAYNATLAGNDILVNPQGFVSVLLFGTGFGSTAARLAREGKTLASTIVTATLGATGGELVASSCAVTVANTVIQCLSLIHI